MSRLTLLARNYRFLARQLRHNGEAKYRGTLSAQLLVKAADSYDAMAEVAQHIERTHQKIFPDHRVNDTVADDSNYTSNPYDNSLSWFGLAATFRRMPIILFASLAVLTAAAWAISIYQAGAMSAPMEMPVANGVSANGMGGMAMSGADWSFLDAASFMIMWTVMMAAMMLPSIAPLLIVFVSVTTISRQATPAPTLTLVAGYLLVWGSAGLLGYLLLCTDAFAVQFAPVVERPWEHLMQGATLIAAGMYQFTPLKRICLRHCRSPHTFIVRHWREGRINALKLGLKHGAYCLGCCWLLFVVLAAVGIMSLKWMVLLMFLVFVERTLPLGQVIASASGVLLVIVGIAAAAGLAPAL